MHIEGTLYLMYNKQRINQSASPFPNFGQRKECCSGSLCAMAMTADLQCSQQPLVSLIVPMHQSAPYLYRSLASVQAQTYANLEVLLIDDGSTDDTVAIAQSFMERDSRFHLIRLSGEGVSAARNAGLDAATGAWIASMDSDDELLPTSIHTLVSTALQNNVAMSMGCYVECHEGKPFSFRRRISAKPGVFRTTEEVQRYFLTDGQFLCHMWTKLFRRDLFDHLRFPVGKIYEDNFIMPDVLEAAGSCAIVNEPVYHYLVRSGSVSTAVDIRHQMDGMEARLYYADFMAKHHRDLVPLANDVALSFACNLLAKMEHIGIDAVPNEWQETLATIERLLPQCALQNGLYRLGAKVYRISPRIVSRVAHFALKLDRMF